MRRLPRRDLAQPFTAELIDAQVGIVEGGPGFGRSGVLADVCAEWPHERLAWPEIADTDVGQLRQRLGATLRPTLVHVDDADRLPAEARAGLAALARTLPARHRLILVTTGHCPVIRELAGAGLGPVLGPARLLLSLAEIEQRLHGVVRHPDRAARAALRGTGGWPEGVQALLAAGWPGRGAVDAASTAAELVARRVTGLPGHARQSVLRAMALPRMREVLLSALVPDVDTVALLLGARVPLLREDGDAWRLPYPLGRLLPLPRLHPDDALRAAFAACDTGLAAELFQLMCDGTRDILVLDLLDDASGPESEELLAGWRAPASLSAVVARDMPTAAERLLLVAERAGHPDRQPFLRQVEAEGAEEEELDERLRARAARELLQRGKTGRAREAAAAVLRVADTMPARAIALEVLGRAARRGGTEQGFDTAERLLKESLALWRHAEEPSRVADLRLCLAWLDRDRARLPLALDRVRSVRASVQEHGPVWAQAALIEADLLCDVGCCEMAGDLLDRLEVHSFHWAGPRIASRAAALRARSALHRGRWDEAEHWANEVSALPMGWMDGVCGLRNLAVAADVWSRLGHDDRAATCLNLLATQQHEPDLDAVLARAAVAARGGDPATALPLLRGLMADEGVPPRARWRVLLLAALAARRAGAADAAKLAEGALRAAGATGQSFAPFVQEREAVRALLGSGVGGAG